VPGRVLASLKDAAPVLPAFPFDSSAGISDLIQRARAQFRPGRAGGRGTLYVNAHAGELLRILTDPDGPRFQGVALSRENTRTVFKNIGNVPLRHLPPGGRTQLHRFEQELLKAAQEARSVVVVEAERGKRTSLVKGTRREEQAHAEQHELASTGEGVDHFPALKFYAHPLVPAMARRLRAKGYTAPAGYNAKHLAVEIGAKIAAGKYRELGITPEQAFSVMNHYRGLLERTHGSARASRIVEAGYNSLRRAGYGKPNQKLRKGQNLLGPGQSRSGGELQAPDEGRGGGRGDRDARGVEPDLSE
jgi:hypothetical protein